MLENFSVGNNKTASWGLLLHRLFIYRIANRKINNTHALKILYWFFAPSQYESEATSLYKSA